jgi:hypothetical protein
METWQFSLFFAALAVGYVMVHLRIVRFEEHLRGLAMLRSIDERLQALSQQIPQRDHHEQLARMEQQLSRLREAIEDVRETAQQVGESLGDAIVRIPQPPAPVVVEGGTPVAAPSSGDRARATVETRLLQLGYSNLRILNDLASAPTEGDIEVQVECERRHMPYKGRVLVRNGAIRDVALQSVATSFP